MARRTNPLAKYLGARGALSQSELARRAGLSRQFVSDFLAGRCGVSRESAEALERATDGRVSAADLVLVRPSREA